MSVLAEKEQDGNIGAAGGLSADAISEDWLARRVAGMVEDEEPVDADENLLFYGVDSIAVMELAAELSKAGIAVSFAELAETPTLAAWWDLIAARLPA